MPAKRLRWMVAGAAFSYASKAKSRRDIDLATAELSDRLPEPLLRLVSALPGDIPRVGGAAIVAGNRANAAAKTTVAITRAAGSASRAAGRMVDAPRHLGERLRGARAALGDDIELERRRIKADVVRQTAGERAAIDAQLDLRLVDGDPLPQVMPPIPPGRRRHQPPTPVPQVARRQRSYRPPASLRMSPPRNRSADQ